MRIYIFKDNKFASRKNSLQACSQNSAFQMFSETFNGAGPPDKNVLA